MIPKLKRKFILINMCLVSVVLLIVFIAIGLFTYQRVKSDTVMAMEKATSREMGMVPPPREIGKDIGKNDGDRHGPLLPIFSVLVDDDGFIISISKENVSVTESVVSEITESVQESGQKAGILFKYELRYMIKETPEGTKIAYADMTREIETMKNLLTSMLMVGVGALGAFFIVSLYLSKWALKPVETAWEQQKRFIADASHELKTPLTVILANTGILLAHKDEKIADQQKWVEYTQVEANRMKQLVEDLLFLAKYDADHKPTLSFDVNLSDALWSCLLPFESVAFENGVSMDSDIQPDIMLKGNEGQLKQLALILIDNACKYAGHGGSIAISLKKQGEVISLVVHNTGSVIPKEHLEHIFDRFYRVDSARAREKGGYGLGLAIASTIVEAHGGKISVESDEAVGTSFKVKFID